MKYLIKKARSRKYRLRVPRSKFQVVEYGKADIDLMHPDKTAEERSQIYRAYRERITSERNKNEIYTSNHNERTHKRLGESEQHC